MYISCECVCIQTNMCNIIFMLLKTKANHFMVFSCIFYPIILILCSCKYTNIK